MKEEVRMKDENRIRKNEARRLAQFKEHLIKGKEDRQPNKPNFELPPPEQKQEEPPPPLEAPEEKQQPPPSNIASRTKRVASI